MNDQHPRGPRPSTAPSAPPDGDADLPSSASRLAACDDAPGQASAQPHPPCAPDTNTSVAGEEDPGAALDMATVGAADAAARRPAQALA